ncbi:GNAT family N-acetyltransferase [Nocardioides jiangxiensis]|uniref:GNAT family N-acetyltransferase n=1 Tax=Nocardioides jiangxiensis TaxID=3064524 RepID=A0ABT9B5S3_9ACTN|nr:GNAT family N-acetyltransferase [Nocardioides sp. WY-20]MDO7869593.1 GNAT family N-acetyltransferase [Nocardioides sp. WY-20]
MTGQPPAVRGVALRRGVPVDAGALAALHLDVWEDAYADLMPDRVFEERRAQLPQRVASWRSLLESADCSAVVAETRDGLVGFATVGPAQEPDPAVPAEELWTLYLRTNWWGRGLGHALLAEVLGERPAHLWVLVGNHRATTFYERHGFVADGARRSDDLGAEVRMVRG